MNTAYLALVATPLPLEAEPLADRAETTERRIAPTAFNTPRALEEILRNNDVQLFDLANDPEEVRNLAIEPEKNRATILRMNELLNDLIAKEVGVNDGCFFTQLGVGSRALTGGDASARNRAKERGRAGCSTVRGSTRNCRGVIHCSRYLTAS